MIETSLRDRSRSVGIIAAAMLAVVLFACNDNPTTIGSDYLPGNVEFHTYTLAPEDFQIESGIATISNSSSNGSLRMVIGRSDDGVTAHGLFAITTAVERFKALDQHPLTSASFSLRSYGYKYGVDTSGPIALDLVVLDGTFSNEQQWTESLNSLIENAPVIGSYTGAYPDSTSISFTMDLAATSEYLKSYFEYDNLKNVKTLKTLAVRARNEQHKLVSFVGYSSDSRLDTLQPTLKVTVGDTTVTLRTGVSNWITTYDVATGTGKFVLGGGLPARALLRIKIDSIPPTATIHRAQLVIHADPTASRYGSSDVTTFIVAYLADSTTLDPATLLANRTLEATASRVALDSNSFTDRFDFSSLAPTITKWQRYRRGSRTEDDAENRGLVIALNRASFRPDLEAGSVDHITFYGPNAADPALRPSLVITYSIQTDAK